MLQLVEEGQLGLDDPIGHWLPGVVPNGGEITVRELLNHTSGLYNVTDTLPLSPPSAFLSIRWRHWTLPELLSRAVAHPPVFQRPGSQYSYSDTNYLALGLLVERITGHSYTDEIRARVIEPLHLRRTYEPGRRRGIAGPHAHGYLPAADGSLIDITRLDPSVFSSGGDLISTGHDLNRFFAALLQGRLVNRSLLRQMTTATAPATAYGLGIKMLTLGCGPVAIGHDGDVPGYSTWSFHRPGRQITVSITWGSDRPKEQVLALIDDALC